MDFRVVSIDGVVGSDTSNTTGFDSIAGAGAGAAAAAAASASDPEAKQKKYGSGLLKKERSVTIEDVKEGNDWRSSKLLKTVSNNESVLLRNTSLKSNATLFPSGIGQQQQQQMLSFSCPKSEALSVEKNPPNNPTLPYFHLTTTPSGASYNRNTGYNFGSYNGVGMYGVFTETRCPFTQSQWMELEHQALIYKYITANVPIPPNLLIPIRKALDSAGFSCISGGFLRPNSLGWGTFHLGFSGSTDPEPGRCRRTDGKKWRCSRDAVADQKYCERHMNRGRHRSRKPVEGQSAAATNTTVKSVLAASPSMSAVSAAGPGGSRCSSNSLAIAQQQQLKGLHTTSSSNVSAAFPSGMFFNKESEKIQDAGALSMVSSNIDLKSKESPFLISRQHKPYEETPSTDQFGVVASDSLLNPSQKGSSFMACRTFSQDLTNQETVPQRSLRQFMDDWPKSQSDCSAVSWPELDMQNRTQLSISIPMASAGFVSSTSSPNNENASLSPLRLSREFDPIQMGLGVGSNLNEPNQRQANWIPISWGSSMGGPLGEVLHNTSNNSSAECMNSSALDLMTEGWDRNSSPTGVLTKTTFGSLSNSSAGSSPRAETTKINEGVSLPNDLRASSSSLRSSLLPTS